MYFSMPKCKCFAWKFKTEGTNWTMDCGGGEGEIREKTSFPCAPLLNPRPLLECERPTQMIKTCRLSYRRLNITAARQIGLP